MAAKAVGTFLVPILPNGAGMHTIAAGRTVEIDGVSVENTTAQVQKIFFRIVGDTLALSLESRRADGGAIRREIGLPTSGKAVEKISIELLPLDDRIVRLRTALIQAHPDGKEWFTDDFIVARLGKSLDMFCTAVATFKD